MPYISKPLFLYVNNFCNNTDYHYLRIQGHILAAKDKTAGLGER